MTPRVVDKESRLEIGKWQDYRVLELSHLKRYSNNALNPRITHSKIAVLVGAGFSAPLDMPTSGEFRDTLSKNTISLLYDWLAPLYYTVDEIIKDDYLREVIKEYANEPKGHNPK